MILFDFNESELCHKITRDEMRLFSYKCVLLCILIKESLFQKLLSPPIQSSGLFIIIIIVLETLFYNILQRGFLLLCIPLELHHEYELFSYDIKMFPY